jgi:hypothetical protein
MTESASRTINLLPRLGFQRRYCVTYLHHFNCSTARLILGFLSNSIESISVCVWHDVDCHTVFLWSVELGLSDQSRNLIQTLKNPLIMYHHDTHHISSHLRNRKSQNPYLKKVGLALSPLLEARIVTCVGLSSRPFPDQRSSFRGCFGDVRSPLTRKRDCKWDYQWP